MAVSIPSLSSVLDDFDTVLKRVDNIEPLLAEIEEYLQQTKAEDFRRGQGPSGPHRALKPSTRRRHRTGTPLYNTGDLARSHTDPAHGHYHFDRETDGFSYGSSHPLIKRLEAKGYRLVGLRREQWQRINDMALRYFATGSVDA